MDSWVRSGSADSWGRSAGAGTWGRSAGAGTWGRSAGAGTWGRWRGAGSGVRTGGHLRGAKGLWRDWPWRSGHWRTLSSSGHCRELVRINAYWACHIFQRQAGSGSGPGASQTPEDPFSPGKSSGVWDGNRPRAGTGGGGPRPAPPSPQRAHIIPQRTPWRGGPAGWGRRGGRRTPYSPFFSF